MSTAVGREEKCKQEDDLRVTGSKPHVNTASSEPSKSKLVHKTMLLLKDMDDKYVTTMIELYDMSVLGESG